MRILPAAALHAISRCDTTSRPFNIGKRAVVEKYKELIEPFDVMLSPTNTADAVIEAGEKALSIMYAVKDIGLNMVRSSKVCKNIATAIKYMKPKQLLPPTSDAAQLQSLRVYHQVQTCDGVILDLLKWGWILKENRRGQAILKPLRMVQAAAPDSLLNIVNCACEGDCKGTMQLFCKWTSLHHCSQTLHRNQL